MVFPIPSETPYLSTDLNLGQLPAFLERAMFVADDPAQQDMLLVSALTACSYAFPHMKLLPSRHHPPRRFCRHANG